MGRIPVRSSGCIGAKETKELAVMVDTFHPLMLTVEALEIENPDYTMSWAEMTCGAA